MTAVRMLLLSCGTSLFLAGLLPAAYSDMKTRTVPNLASLLLVAAGILRLVVDKFSVCGLLSAIMGAAIGGLPLLIMAIFRGSVGGGDVKLAAGAGFVLGWLPSYLALVAALFAFVIYGWFIQPKKDRRKASCLPFVPFYAAAACGAFALSVLPHLSFIHLPVI